jgi:hypothetical protein
MDDVPHGEFGSVDSPQPEITRSVQTRRSLGIFFILASILILLHHSEA